MIPLLLLLVACIPQDVSGLIQKLNSDDAKERGEASRSLLLIGEPARNLLEMARAHSDKEVSSRASELLRRMDVRRSLTPALLKELPDLDLKLAGAEDERWTEALFEATRQVFSRRDHPTLRSADVEAVAPRAFRGCQPHQIIPLCRLVAAWNLTTAIPELVLHLKNPEKEVRQAALEALRDLEGRAAAPAVMEMLKTEEDEWVLREVIHLLGSWDVREAVPELLHQMKSRPQKDYSLKNAIAETLGLIGTVEIIPDLVAQHFDDKAIIGLDEVASALSRLSPEASIAYLLRAAADADENRRPILLMMLCEIRSSNIIPEVRKLLRDPDHRVRMSARTAFRRLEAKEAIEDLKPFLKEEDRWARLDAAKTLAVLGDSSGLPILLKEFEDVQLRSDVSWSISLLDARPVFPRLLEFAKKRDLSAAWILIRQGGPEEHQIVLSSFEGAPEPARNHLGLMLAAHGQGSALPLLLPRLKDPAFSIRSQAAERIGQMSLREAYPAMVEASRETANSSHYPMIRYLGRLGGTEARNVILPFLDDPNYGRRREALIALEESGIPGVLHLARAMLADENAGVRLQAAAWLTRSGQAEGVPALLPWNRGLFALNALRHPELWKKMAGQKMPKSYMSVGLRGMEEIASATGLTLEVSPDLGGHWPGLPHGARSPIEVLELSNVIIEADRLRLLPDHAAHRFWRTWWSEARDKRR